MCAIRLYPAAAFSHTPTVNDVRRLGGAVALVALLCGGCGGDDEPTDDDTGTGTGTGDDTSGEDTSGADACTGLPPVVDRGGPAPADADIDPGTFDGGVETAFDPASVVQNDDVFVNGIQAGSMTASGVRLWTRTDEATDSVVLRVWRDSDIAGSVVLVHDEALVPTEAPGRYVEELVDGLAPATVYRYAFFAPGQAEGEFVGRSAIGRVRTAFADDMRLSLSMAGLTCTGSDDENARQQVVPFPALSLTAESEVDVLVHLGDYSYNDNMVTLAEYRGEWQRTQTEQGYRDVLSSAGMYVTWDDHEVDNNWDPESFPEQRAFDAITAFYENIPQEPSGAAGRLWSSYRWGQTAEVFLLDLRSERLPSTRTSDAPVFVSQEQLDWLKEGLDSSPAHFKVVLSSVNIANLSDPWDAAAEDRWEGYAAQREELLDFIVDNEIGNVWFLAGDIHVGFIGRLEPEGHPYSKMWEITVGPGGSAVNPLGTLWEEGFANRDVIFPCEQFVFAHGRQNAATILSFDPDADTVRVTFEDPLTGEVLFDEVLQQEPL